MLLGDVIERRWRRVGTDGQPGQSLGETTYCQLNIAALFAAAEAIIQRHGIERRHEAVRRVDDFDAHAEVVGTRSQVSARWVFDSRAPEKSTGGLLQSFVGYEVTSDEPMFDPDEIQLMDFRVPQDEGTQFVYVLPSSPTRALVEFTRFGDARLDEHRARQESESYVAQHLGGGELREIERGVIPMNSAHRTDDARSVIPLGARAGAVKPSTGYAVQFMVSHARAICAGGRIRRVPVQRPARMLFYDSLLLDILARKPELGRPIFRQLFATRRMADVFQFLSEKSSLWDEAAMFMKLPIPPFVSAALRYVSARARNVGGELALVMMMMFVLGLRGLQPMVTEAALAVLLVAGMAIVGIPHGALDHRTLKQPVWSPVFLSRYLGIMALIGMGWWLSPTLSLLLFLVVSAWHFGETEARELGLDGRYFDWWWGTSVLGILLLPSYANVRAILDSVGVLLPASVSPVMSLGGTVGFVLVNIHLAVRWRHKRLALALCFLLACSQLPVLLGFATYFVCRHSLIAWRHLRAGLEVTSTRELVVESLPFGVGGLLVIGSWLALWPLEQSAGWFFVMLSCLTVPHVLCMARWYRQRESAQMLVVPS